MARKKRTDRRADVEASIKASLDRAWVGMRPTQAIFGVVFDEAEDGRLLIACGHAVKAKASEMVRHFAAKFDATMREIVKQMDAAAVNGGAK